METLKERYGIGCCLSVKKATVSNKSSLISKKMAFSPLTKMEEVWKVTKVENGVHCSALTRVEPFKVNYYQGKEYDGVFAFLTLEDTLHFLSAQSEGCFCVWKALAKKAIRPKSVLPPAWFNWAGSSPTSVRKIHREWLEKHYKEMTPSGYWFTPPGSLLCWGLVLYHPLIYLRPTESGFFMGKEN